jgi:hypothetical protein
LAGLPTFIRSAIQVPSEPQAPVRGPSGPIEPAKIKPINPRTMPTMPLRGGNLPQSANSPSSSDSSSGRTLESLVIEPTSRPPRKQKAMMNGAEATPASRPSA